jgi:hypothetical protein
MLQQRFGMLAYLRAVVSLGYTQVHAFINKSAIDIYVDQNKVRFDQLDFGEALEII